MIFSNYHILRENKRRLYTHKVFATALFPGLRSKVLRKTSYRGQIACINRTSETEWLFVFSLKLSEIPSSVKTIC